ncbi:hypothetical protein GS463_09020, partial [Rhodococcus hoagii]|nr:hypothetical protein [Prescottella equi]
MRCILASSKPGFLRWRCANGQAACNDYDVLVVGSGFGGSVTALRLV